MSRYLISKTQFETKEFIVANTDIRIRHVFNLGNQKVESIIGFNREEETQLNNLINKHKQGVLK